MAQKDTKDFATHNSFRKKNDNYLVEKKSVADYMKEIHSPHTPTPDREKIARAAAARAKEEDEKKKERREKAQRQKEEAERAEEAKIEAMKRRAAEQAEILRRKDEIKAREARSYAAVAASERAAKAATDSQMRENVCTFKETQLLKESAEENADFVLHNKVKRPKEALTSEEFLSRNKAAGEPDGAVDRKEAIIAAGTPGAAATNHMQKLTSSSQTKDQEKEIIDVKTSGIFEQQMYSKTVHNHHNGRESLSTAEKVGAHHHSQNGARPKEKNVEPSFYKLNNQCGQNSGQPQKGRIRTAIQQNENSYREEKEILSVTGNEASQSGAGGGKKEIVSVTGYKKYNVKEQEVSRYRDEKSNIHHGELNKRTMKTLEVEEHIPEDIQGCQNGPPSTNRDSRDTNHQRDHSRKSQQYYTPPAQRTRGFHHGHQQPCHKEQWKSNHIYGKKGKSSQNQPPYNSLPHVHQTSPLHGLPRSVFFFCFKYLFHFLGVCRRLCCPKII